MLNSIILSLLVSWSAQAGKTPLTLEELCQTSDLIAVVQTDSSPSHTVVSSDFGSADIESCGQAQSAEVNVVAMLKGEVITSNLELCAPPRSTRIGGLDFQPAQARLVFLQQTATGKYACYSHVGHVRMDGSKLDPYRTAVQEYLKLASLASAERHAQLQQWRVNLALDPITRADGVRMLAAANNSTDLAPGNQKKLIAALCSAPDFGATNQQLFRFLSPSNDPRLAGYALAVVRSWKGKVPWNGRYWIHQTATRIGDTASQEFFRRNWAEFDSYLGGKDWKFVGEGQEQQILLKLLSQLSPAA